MQLSGAHFVASCILENNVLRAIFGECETPIFEYTPLRVSAGSLRGLAQKNPKPLVEKRPLTADWNKRPVLGGAKPRYQVLEILAAMRACYVKWFIVVYGLG